MARYEHLPIYKAAFDLLLYFEKIVIKFSRYHKYVHGTALRQLAKDIVILVIRANNSQQKLTILHEIRMKLEELKITVRVCKEVRAFHNFNSFQTSTNMITQISKQNEGWMKSLSR